MACGCSNCSNCSSCCSTPTCGACQCNSCTSTACTAICTALEIANSWNVPACSASALLAIPGLTTVLIGSYIYNPTYGYFRISAFDSINGQITVVNDCWPDNAAPGTVVPALTTFIFSSPPVLESAGGWTAAGETWTYLSANSVTIPSDGTEKYEVGDKIKLLLSGIQQYYSIISVAPTILTFAVNNDYVLTNNPITEPAYSHAESPVDFPPYFNYVVVPTGFSANPTGTIGIFKVMHGYVAVDLRMPNAGTSNATTFTINAPVTAKTVTDMRWGIAAWQAEDNSALLSSGPVAFIDTASSVITLQASMAAGAWTNAGGKRASFTNLVYAI